MNEDKSAEEIVKAMKERYKERAEESKLSDADVKREKLPVGRITDASFLKKIQELFFSVGFISDTGHFIEAADFKVNFNKYLKIAGLASVFVGVLSAVISVISSILTQSAVDANVIIGMFIVLTAGSFVFFLWLPRNRAMARASLLDRELPFALRHMAAQLRSGIGFLQVLKGVSEGDYVVVNRELGRVVKAVDEGKELRDELKGLRERTESRWLKRSVWDIDRALRTGGSMNEIMKNIADEITYEMREETRDFGSKANFFGTLFMFAAIFLPIILCILAALKAVPVQFFGRQYLVVMPVGPIFMSFWLLLIIPIFMFLVVDYVVINQPKV